ncbi:TonB family protein [Roseobacter sp. HKCCD9010]|uniref:cell envelope integrity protein TolA n=1 Tax=unclassified Roseobacter TaxID=196798 RepID=UPI001491EC08|nr:MULTISPECIES: TonB family protein [unclassified Roseobacter]MBF9048394.1 TonB family protein [Rhodobacterales bacterium HKCCD4356]NNV10393.1 TonB family protein [Roseobacter sp. HKCCD7357]NNV14578.1 TonB family protein [Roseobacter sp. HKCCD8768]NNV24037.1 TonB family protein [Roseobacter sp. HKCCD8192]NNV28294.1 TonB family protein [Roseobacter sp. HKCCD9061]
MRTSWQVPAFLTLSVAVHAAAFVQLPDGSASGAGQGGNDRATLEAASGNIAEMVALWTRPPEVVEPDTLSPPPMAQEIIAPTAPEPVHTQPAATSLAMELVIPERLPLRPQAPAPAVAPMNQMMALPSPDMFDAITRPQPLVTENRHQTPPPGLEQPFTPDVPPDAMREVVSPLAVARSQRPDLRPERPQRVQQTAPQTSPPRAAQPQQIAAGSGGAEAQGQAETATAATLSASERQSLMARWGAQIHARIERRKPRVSGQGVVTLQLSIGRDGRLQSVAVAASSGNAQIDQAGISAVQRAGRFPTAPDGLAEPSYRFNLPIRFL